MPDQPYTVEQGFECCQDGGYRLYSCAYCPCMKPDRPPCLVVTGDLDAARRRLAPLDDAAIERAARAIEGAIDKHGPFVAMTTIAREVLAAAEETGDA